MDGDRAHPNPNASRRFPVEVFENIIDMLYSVFLTDRVEDTRALHSCALVCRAWRVRSQRNLFYSVVLHDVAAIEKLSTVLANAPHLCEYVHEVTLIGRPLHTTASPLSLLPIALHGKLPKLQDLHINRVQEDEDWYPRMSELESAKSLQYLPLHPRFSLFFSAFTTISRLFIYNTTFRYFNDFARMVNSLPALEILICDGVRCVTLGPLPFNMKPRADGIHAPAPPFAPNLRFLALYDVDIHCVQRLVSACGPRLTGLTVLMPFFYDAEMVLPGDLTMERTVGVDLSLCSTLEQLGISLGPEFATDGQSLDRFKAMLGSLGSEVPLRYVRLFANHEDVLTRQGFADILGTVGRVMEDLLHESSAQPSADGEVGEQCRRWRIWFYVWDWEIWLDWWWTYFERCFPTLAKSGELRMTYQPPSHDQRKWKDSGAPRPKPTTAT
ncbi:hypothetical protein BD309DRAFT_995454 [Dichomitus squalens]|nr:hypothetical protein BD309DRAFT_995454 [Dichomitus squalens]